MGISHGTGSESGFPDGGDNLVEFDSVDFVGGNGGEEHIFFVGVFKIEEDVDGFATDSEVVDDVDNNVNATGVLNDAVNIEKSFDAGLPSVLGEV